MITSTQRDRDYERADRERAYARERMRAKRQNPEFYRREKAVQRAQRRLAREHRPRFMELLEEELKQ